MENPLLGKMEFYEENTRQSHLKNNNTKNLTHWHFWFSKFSWCGRMPTKVLLLNFMSILSHDNNECISITLLKKYFILNGIHHIYKNLYAVIGKKVIPSHPHDFLYYINWPKLILFNIEWKSLTLQKWK